MANRWYVVRVQSGRENTVQAALERKIRVAGKTDVITRVLVPVESVTEVKAGRKRTRKKKLYPGYVLVEIAQDEKGKIPMEGWALVRDTAGVGDFVGPYNNPDPLPQDEVDKVLAIVERSADRAPQVQIAFKKGDSVKIREGPLESFDGVVDEVIPAKGAVRVIVTIFGRATPVDLEYWQVEAV
jgi:transcriptional antiterminator NusG